MPNWCSTRIIFSGDNESLRDFYEKLEMCTSENYVGACNGFGKMWLGNIVSIFEGDYHKVHCRGSIEYLDNRIDTNGTIVMDTETAWDPCIEMFDEIIQKNYVDDDGVDKIYYDYIAEEFGCGIYITNNFMAFSDQAYCVDACIDGRDIFEYLGSEDEVVSCINDEYDMKFKSLNEILVYDFGNDNFVAIRELEEV